MTMYAGIRYRTPGNTSHDNMHRSFVRTQEHITWQCTQKFTTEHLATHHIAMYTGALYRALGNTSHDNVHRYSAKGT